MNESEQELYNTLVEWNDSLRALSNAIRSVNRDMLDTRDKLSKVIEGGHLRSTLTMLQSDITLRRTLELAYGR